MDRTLLTAILTASVIATFTPDTALAQQSAVSAAPQARLPSSWLPVDFLATDLADVSDIIEADRMTSDTVAILLTEGSLLLAG
ncbi:MAG TPA: hypothetical protein VJR58_07275 [Vineibacter sp.]|nr:hypothetical protein [Vineibacter sp.]